MEPSAIFMKRALSALPAKSLRDVGRNGDSCTSHLHRQTVSFRFGKAGRELVDGEHELMGFAPYQEIGKCSGSGSMRGHNQKGVRGSMLRISDHTGGSHERLFRAPQG